MCDSGTVICYLKGEKDAVLPHFPNLKFHGIIKNGECYCSFQQIEVLYLQEDNIHSLANRL